MKLSYLALILFLFFIAPSANLSAQRRSAPVIDSSVIKMFEPKANLVWLRTYQVSLDDAITARLNLGFDGNVCRGIMTYNQSKETTRLSGTLISGEIILFESGTDELDKTSLEGRLSDESIEGSWVYASRKKARRLSAKLVKSTKLYPTIDCGTNKWYQRYETSFENQEVVLILARIQDQMMIGQFWSEALKMCYNIKGSIAADGKATLYLTDAGTQQMSGTLKGQIGQKQKLSLALERPNAEKKYLHFNLSESLSASCVETADQNTAFDIVYPKTKSSKGNQLLDQLVEQWLISTRASFKTNQKKSDLLSTAWTEITCWEKELFSGILTTYSSLDTSWQAATFHFNPAKNKAISLDELFIDNFNHQTWLTALALKNKVGQKNYASDQAYAQWVDANGFPLQYFRRDGLVLSTTFHPIYGRSEILITWEMLKPYLRPKTFATKLVEN